MPKRKRKFTRSRRKTNTKFRNKVKGIIARETESKWIDIAINSHVPVATVPLIIPISLMANGDGPTQREGNSINIISIEMRLIIDTNASMEDNNTGVRVILFRAKRNMLGTLPVVTELMNANTILAIRNRVRLADYKVYYDKTRFVQQNIVTTGAPEILLKTFKSVGGLKTTFNSNGSAITDADSGHWFLMLMTDQIDTQEPTFEGYVRVTFRE